MRLWLVAPLLLVSACKRPVEAPAEVNALSLYLYSNFDAEDEAVLAAGITNLDTFLADKDMTAALNDRAVTLTPLDVDSLGDEAATDAMDPTVQVPVGVWGESAHSLADHVGLVSDENQICIASDSTKFSGRTFTGDLPCWESGTCRSLTTTNEVRIETALANVWMDVNADFRMIALDDGRDAMISRGYMPRKYLADGGSNSWDQRFTIDVWLPSADGAAPTKRYYAMWSSVTLAGVSDDIYANLVKSGVDEYYANTDGWIDGTECKNPRDRENDRPAQ